MLKGNEIKRGGKFGQSCPVTLKRNSKKMFPLDGNEIQNNWRRGIICQYCLVKRKK